MLKTNSDKISKQLECYYKNVNNWHNSENKDFDLNGYNWSPPALSTLLTSFIVENNIAINNIPNNQYLNTIFFSKGIDLYDVDFDFYSNKNYVPVVKIPTESDEKKRNEFLSKLLNKITEICNLDNNYKSAFKYIISEFTDNLIEHSCSKYGYLSFQKYPAKGYVDLCLCDTGIGFLKSYLNYNGNKDYSHINSDIEALEAVMKGDSTKHQEERGFGIRTSVKMIVEGLCGQIIIGSESTLSVNGKNSISIQNMNWKHKGMFLVARIPINKFNENFNFYDFLE